MNITYLFITIIIPASFKTEVENIAETLGGPPASNMFDVGLSDINGEEITHYISTGMIQDTFFPLLTDANLLYNACQQAGLSTSLTECENLINNSDVSQENPIDAINRLNLSIFNNTDTIL